MPRFRIPARLGLLCLLLAGVARAQGFDEMLPDSTVFYISVENYGRTQERWKTCPLSAFWNDEAVKAFTEQPLKKWSEWMDEARAESGITPEEVLGVVSGQVALAITSITPQEGKDDKVAMVILADVGSNADKVKELISKAEAREAEKKELGRQEEEFEGVTIVSYAPDSEEEGAEQSCWLLDGKLFAMSNDTANLKALLAQRGHPGEGTLSAREGYRKVRERLGGRGDLVAYVDGGNLFKALREGKDGPGEEGMKIMDALGLTAIQGAGLQLALEDQGIALNLHILMSGPKEGILKLFGGQNAGLSAPGWVPADAASWGAWVLDLNDLWDEAMKVADKIEAGSSMKVDGWLQSRKAQTGVDIKADLLGSLGDQLNFYTKVADPNEPGAFLPLPGLGAMRMPRFGFAIQVKNHQAFSAAVDGLLAQALAGGMIQEETYLDSKLRSLQMGMPGMTPCFVVLPDQFLFAFNLDDLKEVVGRYGKEELKGLADSGDYAKAMAGLPAQCNMLSYSDMAKGLSGSSWITTLNVMGQNLFDKSRFPSLEVLKRYLGASTSVGINEEDGWFYGLYYHMQKPAKAAETGGD